MPNYLPLIIKGSSSLLSDSPPREIPLKISSLRLLPLGLLPLGLQVHLLLLAGAALLAGAGLVVCLSSECSGLGDALRSGISLVV
jgi:hypothetical protein